jgi:hypothetical protein
MVASFDNAAAHFLCNSVYSISNLLLPASAYLVHVSLLLQGMKIDTNHYSKDGNYGVRMQQLAQVRIFIVSPDKIHDRFPLFLLCLCETLRCTFRRS